MSRRIPLAELDAEITTTRWEHDEVTDSLWLGRCPICGDAHGHVIPFRPGGGKTRSGRNVWTHDSGSTIADITLSPSYLASGGQCIVHLFVREGVAELLDDSRSVP